MKIANFVEKFFGMKVHDFQKEILEKKNLKISTMPQRSSDIVPVHYDPRIIESSRKFVPWHELIPRVRKPKNETERLLFELEDAESEIKALEEWADEYLDCTILTAVMKRLEELVED